MHNAIRPFDGMTGELVQEATLNALRMAQMNFAREEYDRLERLILQQILPALGGRTCPIAEDLCRHLEQVRTFSGNFCWRHRAVGAVHVAREVRP
jgi:hypothetical protein